MSLISIIIPAYNEGDMISMAATRIKEVAANFDAYEIIFIDDGSRDNTWASISLIAKHDPYIKGIRFSRNFGKESAILAGLVAAKGDAAIVIDCDLQHPPEKMLEMYKLWNDDKSIDVVECIKEARGNESVLYKGFAKLFYSIINRTGKVQIENSSDFQLLDRRIIDILINLPEKQRFFRALSSWVGFNRRQITFRVDDRPVGTSKWNFYKSFKYAVNNITSFTTIPLHVVTLFGLLFFVLAVVLGIHTLVAHIFHQSAEGFSTVILLLLIIGSMIMISLGILGLYVAKIYEEIKSRPSYLVAEHVNIAKVEK